ncbi:MAG: LysR family transcriptional regulator [Myxococcota bacterium]
MDRAVIDGIEALAALEQTGTVGEAATRLRLTQSAVSKRLAALQRQVGSPIVAPDGRRVRITAEGAALLERARPLLAGLRDLCSPMGEVGPTRLSLALADSIAASWGPAVVARALAEVPGLTLELHAHRSVLALERVRLGRYHLVLATGPAPPDLLHVPVVDEPLVELHGPVPGGPLITIEPTSATWRAVEGRLRRRHPELFARELVPVESFGAALQMVRAGFGDGLLPLGLVQQAGLAPTRALTVSREVCLAGRKTIAGMPAFGRLAEALARHAASWFVAFDLHWAARPPKDR